ncbi:MAG: PAS domain S-box protein [Halobaculum sp.]
MPAAEVLAGLPTPVIAHDPDGTVVYANEASRAVVSDPVGSDISDVLDGYEQGAGGGLVTPHETDETYLASVRTPEAADGTTVLTLRGVESGQEGDEMTTGEGTGVTGQASNPFERIFEHANDAIFVVDPTAEEITRVNRRACELLGYDREELLTLSPRDVHPHNYEEFREFTGEVYEEGSGWTDELSCYTCEGEIVPTEVSGTVVEVDGRRQLVASVRDISTRVEQREELRRLSRAIEATTEGVAVFDRDGMATYANPAFAETVGVADADDVRGRTWPELFDDGDRFQMAVLPAAEDDGWTETVRFDSGDGERAYAVLVTAFEDHLLCVARDVTERERRIDRLRGLTAASRAFVDADDPATVAESAVEVIMETLDHPAACVWLYDEEGNTLNRAATTPAAERLLADEVAYDMDSSRAGSAFRSGERLVVEPGDDAYAADRGHLHVPVGDWGVVTITAADGFNEETAETVELFAEVVRTALARVDRVQRLRAREAELDDRRSELAAAVAFNDLVTDVIRSVLSASTRRETERGVCERLAAADEYDGAWLVDDDRSVRARAVTETVPLGTEFIESPFVDRLLANAGEGVTVERRQFDDGERTETTTAAAVPVACGDQRFGTLVLAATTDDAFPDAARSGLALLAETLGFGLVAGRSREALMSSDVTEVVVELPGVFSELSAACDCRCVLRETSATESGEMAYTVEVEGTTADAVRSVVGDQQGVQSVTPNGERCEIRVVGSDRAPEVVAETGANVRSLVAEDGRTRLTAELPRGVAAGDLLGRLRSVHDEVSLHAKRSSRSLPLERPSADRVFTDRQREVVCAAHESGYYEWPREHTAEEVADRLDIAGSTFHQHLRTAHRKLAARLCDE